MGDRKRNAVVASSLGALIALWALVRIGSAYDDLWRYGVDRPAHAGLGQAAAAIGLVGFVFTAVALVRMPEKTKVAAAIAAGGSVVAGAYLLWMGVSHSDYVGFESSSLVLLGLVIAAYGVVVAWRSLRIVEEEP